MAKLRESGQPDQFDLGLVLGQAEETDGGVADGQALLRFARAVINGGDDLAGARAAAVAVLGRHRTAQAAAVIAGFDGINRVADATGIELNIEMVNRSRDLVESLGLERMRAL